MSPSGTDRRGDPVLVFDDRPPPGQAPTAGFHALIVGVSAYSHLPGGGAAPPAGSATAALGLTQLQAPALTAHRIFRWLHDHRAELPVPLHTVRLLLAPSAAELAAEPAIAQEPAGVPTYAGFQAALNEWRTDVARFAKSMALLFYSGHGLGGTGEDALMLASDFGDPQAALLDRAISITDVEQGMAPPRPGGRRTIGRKQVYLIDACRNRPPGLTVDSAAVPTVWTEQVRTDVDDRELAILLATINSKQAYVGKDGEATVFGQAVLDCLQGAAALAHEQDGTVRWSVVTTNIGTVLPELMEERTKALRVTQAFRAGRQLHPVRLVTFAQTPLVSVTFPTVGATAPANLQLDLHVDLTVHTISPLELPAREHRLPMGHYNVIARAVAEPPAGTLALKAILRPPRREIPVNF